MLSHLLWARLFGKSAAAAPAARAPQSNVRLFRKSQLGRSRSSIIHHPSSSCDCNWLHGKLHAYSLRYALRTVRVPGTVLQKKTYIYILEECKALWGSPDRVAICRYECGESDGAWTHTLLLRDTTPMQYT